MVLEGPMLAKKTLSVELDGEGEYISSPAVPKIVTSKEAIQSGSLSASQLNFTSRETLA